MANKTPAQRVVESFGVWDTIGSFFTQRDYVRLQALNRRFYNIEISRVQVRIRLFRNRQPLMLASTSNFVYAMERSETPACRANEFVCRVVHKSHAYGLGVTVQVDVDVVNGLYSLYSWNRAPIRRVYFSRFDVRLSHAFNGKLQLRLGT